MFITDEIMKYEAKYRTGNLFRDADVYRENCRGCDDAPAISGLLIKVGTSLIEWGETIRSNHRHLQHS